MIELPLYKSGEVVAYTQIDDDDFDLLNKWKWSLSSSGYVRRCTRNRKINYQETIIMHRFIVGLGRGDPLQADHIDLNPLNNQRSNLRIVTNDQNMQNRSSMKGSSSSHRGVFWRERDKKWQAKVTFNGKTKYLGYFSSEEEAAIIVREWRAINMPFSVEV